MTSVERAGAGISSWLVHHGGVAPLAPHLGAEVLRQFGTEVVATGDVQRKKTRPSCTDARAEQWEASFPVISGESLNSIYCSSAVRARQRMPSRMLSQAEDRCSDTLGNSCQNVSDPVLYPGCASDPPAGTHKTEQAELSPGGTTCRAARCQPGDTRAGSWLVDLYAVIPG